jgi:hypothetical protein
MILVKFASKNFPDICVFVNIFARNCFTTL